MLAKLASVQGAYYLITGVWPLLSPGSFQAITGPKADFWLAQTVGVLVALTGGLLLRAARRNRFSSDLALLAGLQAAALGVVDVWCVTQPNTTRVYLLDAALELGFVIAWARGWHRRPPAGPSAG